MSDSREREVTRAFVDLASSLVSGYDVVDLLNELTADCAHLLGIASAGLLLADERRVLHVVAASSERTRQLELFQVQRADGPCRDCYLDGAPVSAPDLRDEVGRWPQFAPAALKAGFASVHALPMRLHDQILGALGLFGTSSGALNSDDLSLGQALADVASVAIVQDKEKSDQRSVNEQLQTALQSRIVLEQAKGVLAQTGSLQMDDAFAALRRYARDHNLRLTAVAEAVVMRRLPAQQLLAPSRDTSDR